ncbi:hypothetical protein MBGDC06_00698, partial [Thermoplasmatales archaeon SCGC AB-539-C06]
MKCGNLKKNGLWYFHLKAPNGEVIASSEGYNTKDNCRNGIDSLKKYAPDADIHEKVKYLHFFLFFLLIFLCKNHC